MPASSAAESRPIRRSIAGALTPALLALSVLLAVAPAPAAAGGRDRSGTRATTTTTRFGAGTSVADAVQQVGSQTIVAGRVGDDITGNVGVARYNLDGSLDPGFGTGGRVVSDFGASSDFARDLGVQSDGKIIVGGTSNGELTGNFLLARYTTAGVLDPTFGTGGRVLTDVSGVGDGIRGLVVLPDDRIVAAGAAGPDSAIVRYRADGSLDPTFGTRGVVLTRAGLADHFFDLAVDRVGRYVAVGTANSDFLVARYDANGEPDESFADHGRATTGFDAGQSDLAFHVELDDDGAIIAAGETGAVDPVGFTASRFALARYRPDGTLDTQFGRGGKVATDIASGPGAAADGIRGAVLRAGKLTVAGFCGEAHGITSFLDPLVGQFCVARYDAVSGRLDSGFGSGGVIVIDFPGGGAGARAIVMAPSGALTVVGGAAAPTTLAFAIARYPREGTQTTGAGGT